VWQEDKYCGVKLYFQRQHAKHRIAIRVVRTELPLAQLFARGRILPLGDDNEVLCDNGRALWSETVWRNVRPSHRLRLCQTLIMEHQEDLYPTHSHFRAW